MQAFEYKVIPYYELGKDVGMENALNELGRMGWELVMRAGTQYIFKRPLQA